MADKQYEYIAHIQKDGNVREVTGKTYSPSPSHVYQWLLQMAQTMGGWLLQDQITEAGNPDTSCYTYDEDTKVSETTGTVIGAKDHWFEFNMPYSGASCYTGRKENVKLSTDGKLSESK